MPPHIVCSEYGSFSIAAGILRGTGGGVAAGATHLVMVRLVRTSHRPEWNQGMCVLEGWVSGQLWGY